MRTSCTTLIATPGACADGVMRVAHSCDDALADQRVVFVPAHDWPEGSRRTVWLSAVATGEQKEFHSYFLPRIWDADRAPAYADAMGRTTPMRPLGSIPQVPHTYAYLDGNYGIMNEKGLMFGECTSKARNECTGEPGKRLFYSSELSRVALERCTTAREAVELMGRLIEEYGYYGTGETLPVADRNEAWVMEMAPSDNLEGGLWVAQRLPDGTVFVEANLLRIRILDPDSHDQLMCPQLAALARKTPGQFDWTAYSSTGEYHHPYYSHRRVWRTYDLIAPSLNLSPQVDGLLSNEYPFAVKPDKPLTRQDIFRIYRDHYEGTQFDLTKGIAAGPWGNPHRGRPTDDEEKTGAWERAISMVDTGYAYVCEAFQNTTAPFGQYCWLSQGTPAEVPFVPLAVAPLPPAIETCDPRFFSPETSAWWTYNLVAQYAELRYCDMIRDIQEAMSLSENRAEEALGKFAFGLDISIVATELNRLAERTRKEFQTLFGHLVVKYNQGYICTNDIQNTRRPIPNTEWLKASGFHEGPIAY